MIACFFVSASRTLATSISQRSAFYSRKMATEGVIKIGTHDGVFHCDDALACFMLRLLPEYSTAKIIRTRNPDLLNTCHTVVDVGAVYDHSKRRYDHHHREFTETLSSVRPELGDKYTIKLSSAGLIYAHYGESIIEQLAANSKDDINLKDIRVLYKKVYENFIEEIDAIDNGVVMCDTEPRYKIRTHISARVHRLNPEWNSSQEQNLDRLFQDAMNLVGEEFMYNVDYFMRVWLPARTFVKESLEKRFEVHESGAIVEFTERFPWKEHLFDLEAEMGIADVKYVLFMDKPDSWRVQAVPLEPTSFKTRKPLHKSWWGVRDETLSQVSGIDGSVFCHATGFIGGNRTREGALKMAVTSLHAE